MQRLRVSENRRFLVQEDESPFFYLGDTAWEIFHRLTREEADTYLENRAAKRFTVIQAVVLAEHDGLHTPNAYGHTPLHNDDPAQPDEDYFAHVDYVIGKAESHGLYVGLLPTWGDKWNRGQQGVGPEIFNPVNARLYGRWLAERYQEKPVLWILGGDRSIESDTHRAIIRGMAAGIREHIGDTQLITFHPRGQETSSTHFHEDDWLDFNMYQTGHTRNRDNGKSIAEDYARVPIKPCLDGEPGYEDHPSAFNPQNGYLDAYDTRKAAYWALFAGACGHTYGCHDIWQFYTPERAPITAARTPWQRALDFPGAAQMQFARRLLESRPFLTRIPDQRLSLSEPGTGNDHIQATRCEHGTYGMIYLAAGRRISVNTGHLRGEHLRAYWYDPRNGEATLIGEFPRTESRDFVPPRLGFGQDWVLVLDDAAQDFPAPGADAL